MNKEKDIRATYNAKTIRVYQAYSHQIAEAALENQTFTSPPFKMERMTWIKPSFLWMMYRAGYGHKDDGQRRILALDITHEGFRWALENSSGSHIPEGMSAQDWTAVKANKPVRIQWDPERDIHHNPLPYRSIQIGLTREAVQKYVAEWIVSIEDVTPLAHQIYDLIQSGEDEKAKALCPTEQPYNLIESPENYG
ncbi:MAG: DUF4291 domain-containing protein [Maricaulaceae bacterium]